MRRALPIVLALAAGGLLYFLIQRRNTPPEIPFARVVREEIVSTLSTNGKVQPIEWAEAHAETGGGVVKTFVQKGQRVDHGAPLVELDAPAARADLAAAEARIAQSRAELETLRQGGRSSERSAIDSAIQSARQELAVSERDLDALKRLQAKSAATADDVRAASDRVDRARLQIQSTEARRSTLVNSPDMAAAEGRLREATASADAAKVRIGLAVVRAPIAGVVYQFDIRAGAYLNPGDLVAGIGRLDRVRVVIYVDEPDLGKVEVGKPVTITWDAIAGRQWKGVVDKLPTQVAALGTRQVGEVGSVIDNPDQDLLPGTNVNAEIRSQSVQNAIVVPTAAIRRDGGKTGVLVLADGHLEWRDVKLGLASAARTQVEGLKERESVALPTDRTLAAGMPVTAVYP